jgi:hypothetical protein
MSQASLVQLLQAQAKLLSGMSAAQLTLEKIVLALIETHPDKAALLSRIESSLELDTVVDLFQAQQPELEQAGDQQRRRLLNLVRRSCAT